MSGEPIQLDIPNFCTPSDGLCCGGLVGAAALRQAREQGLRRVINLCPESETPDEAERVRQLGMDYVNIPISGPQDLNADKARALAEALADGAPTLVHCASGNRVGALFALKAFHVDGKSPQQALEIGRAHGLTKLEPAVRALLGA